MCRIIQFLSRRLATPANALGQRPAMQIRARMSLGGLLYDAIYQSVWERPRTTEEPTPVEATLQPGDVQQVPGSGAQAQLTAPAPGLGDLGSMGLSMDDTDFAVFGWLK